MIKITFVDDEPRLRLAWQKLLSAQPDLEVVAVLSEVDNVEESVSRTRPDVLILDLVMPGVDPLQIIRSLELLHPEVKVVVYSAHSDSRIMREVFDAGAWGYVDKLASPEDMFTVVRRVADGEVVFPTSLVSPGQ